MSNWVTEQVSKVAIKGEEGECKQGRSVEFW